MSATVESLPSTPNVVNPAETPQESEACYLLVAVTDIRGFTSLTARVNQFCQSRLNRTEHVQLLSTEYIQYMRSTQKLARTLMMKELPDYARGDLAVKSTGDGYMVAVRLDKVDDKALMSPESRDRAEEITWKLVEGVRQLVENARPTDKEDGSFAGLTRKLIRERGIWLGIALEDYETGKADLHVAGGISLGTGFFSDNDVLLQKTDSSAGGQSADDEKQPGLIQVPERDAFGHAANLAFRLCDKAGRGDKVPAILLDRRVGMLVRQKIPVGYNYVVRAYRDALDLKGIEETWCMCYVSGAWAKVHLDA